MLACHSNVDYFLFLETAGVYIGGDDSDKDGIYNLFPVLGTMNRGRGNIHTYLNILHWRQDRLAS